MKFLADENVDKPIVERLRKNGHDVFYVMEMEPSISDDDAIKQANQESALLLTADNDFGELAFRQGHVVYTHVSNKNTGNIKSSLGRLFEKKEGTGVKG
jgi:predicted nuclease of predicted toxin-antitoxin system